MHNSSRKSVQLFVLLLLILSVCALRMYQRAPLPGCPQSAEEWQQQWMLSFINELSQHSALSFPCFQSIYKGKTWLLPNTLPPFAPMHCEKDFCMLKVCTAKCRSPCFSEGCLWKAQCISTRGLTRTTWV